MGRFYVTTPIYYVNDAPHVGSAYTTVNADALARWHRLVGDEVLFLTGTDEHGQKVADAAARGGLTPRDLADRNAARFREAWDAISISYDDFIRTTEARHHTSVQAFLSTIHENGYIYKGVYQGLYCVSCEDYYTYEASDEGRCPIHGKELVAMEEENWFFRLSAFQDRLLEYYESHPGFVTPETKRNEALAFIRGGLHDISITRTSIDWGVPVPWDREHVFYVWYDALINYLTAIGYGTDPASVERWWPASHHLIGKEIIRFHCVWWPAMLMAAGLEPPHHVHVHGWLLIGGQKLGKTMAAEGAVRISDISPTELAREYGVDPLRYYLLRETALGNDGEFSLEGITQRYNTDLANNLGNLVARVTTLVGSKCAGVGPAPGDGGHLPTVVDEAVRDARDAWDRFDPHDALEATWRIIGAANSHLEVNEPWRKEAGPEVDRVLGDALEALRLVAVLASPAMPSVCAEIWRRIGLPGSPTDGDFDEAMRWGGYPGGLAVERGEALFPRRDSA